MSSAVAAVTPFEDRSRRRRLLKIGAWFLGIALFWVDLQQLGVDVRGWLSEASINNFVPASLATLVSLLVYTALAGTFGDKDDKQLVGESCTEAKQKAADPDPACRKEGRLEGGGGGERPARSPRRLHRHPREDASADESDP